jgi:PKD domain
MARMRKCISSIILFCAIIVSSYCQSVADIVVPVEVVLPLSADNKINLRWQNTDIATNYVINRRIKGTNSWGSPIATLPGTATTYTDQTAIKALSYEYQIKRSSSLITGTGYISAGIEVPAVEFRGIIILVVESLVKDSLPFELNRLVADLEGDNWQVKTLNVKRNQSVKDINKEIRTLYAQDPTNTKAAFLLGKVPVPYSGSIAPDGHPDHRGAWPADLYYGDIDGTWLDSQVNDVTASSDRNKNIPGDGKFDASIIPSTIDLQVGRVDLFDMPAFGKTEAQLLRQYLDRDHNYRHGKILTINRAIVDDNFGYFSGEAFSSASIRAFSSLVGIDSTEFGDYFSTLSSKPYKWSYGCGGGTYNSASGVGSTTDFVNRKPDGIFTMLFGSYFGDWDNSNNFLRAPLATGKILASSWSGRPLIHFHQMGLGETIGNSILAAQNNANNAFLSGFGNRSIHVALMGDPTLRNEMIQPVSNVVASHNGQTLNVNWQSPAASNAVYYRIYIKNAASQRYTLAGKSETNTFSVPCALINDGKTFIMVQAVALTVTHSGSYENNSQGVFDTLQVSDLPLIKASATFVQSTNKVTWTNTSKNANLFHWDFGDGQTSIVDNPSYTYLQVGNYTTKMVATGDCSSDSTTFDISILSSTNDESATFSLYPNPAMDIVTIIGDKPFEAVNIQQIDISNLSEGRYQISYLYQGNEIASSPLIILRKE